MPQDSHDPTTARVASSWKWIAWAVAATAGLCVAVTAVDRHRMERIRADVEARGGRLEGKHVIPSWYTWLLKKTPSAARGVLLKLQDNFRRVDQVYLPPGSDVPHDLVARLARFRQLTILQLPDCRLTDAGLDGLSKLTELRVLNLSGNPVTDRSLDQLERLPKLAVLLLRDTKAEGRFLTHASKWPELMQLALTGSPISDDGLKVLGTAVKLQTLFLNDTRVSDAGLASLSPQPSLQLLDLQGCAITDQGLSAIDDTRFPNLRALNLSRTDITADGVAKLRLSRLVQLQIPDVALTDGHWLQLASMKTLSRITWGRVWLVRDVRRLRGGPVSVLDSFVVVRDGSGIFLPQTRFPQHL